MENQKQMPDALDVAAEETQNEAVKSGKVKRAFVSLGEKITTFFTYAGVDWLFNAMSGVAFAYWGKKTESGQKYWSQPITNGFKKILGPFIKDEARLEHSAGRGNMFVGIVAGGMFTIPPLLLLEHNPVKKAITKFFDRLIYGREKVENDPKFQQAYKEIDEAPKKDFGMGMVTRFIALSPLLAMVLNPTTGKLSQKYYFDKVANSTKWIADKVGIKPGPKMKEVDPVSKQTNWDFLHDTIAMDGGLGPAYAAMHAVLMGIFSKFKKSPEKSEVRAPQAQSPQQTSPVAPEAEAEDSEQKPAISYTEKYASGSKNAPEVTPTR